MPAPAEFSEKRVETKAYTQKKQQMSVNNRDNRKRKAGKVQPNKKKAKKPKTMFSLCASPGLHYL